MKQIAIIKGVGFGIRDTSKCMLFFSTYISETEAVLQCLSLEEASRMIEVYQVYDVHDLNGKSCWVELQGNSVRYVAPLILPPDQHREREGAR